MAFFEDDDLFKFFCYIIAPEDSVYNYKLIKLRFEIPHGYPLLPPMVKFIQHTGSRLHPNLYVEGKVCLSILGTWPGESWAFGMTTDTVLRTIQSLLDNKPYLHEPQQLNSQEFNDYVRYNSWRSLLLDYVAKETHPPAKLWLERFIVERADAMMAELERQEKATRMSCKMGKKESKVFTSPYVRKGPGVPEDYPKLRKDLEDAVLAAKTALAAAAGLVPVFTGYFFFPKNQSQAPESDASLIQGASGTKRKLSAEAAADPGHGAPAGQLLSAEEVPVKRPKKEIEVIDLT